MDAELFKIEAAAMKAQEKKKKVYKQMCKTQWGKVFETARQMDKSIKGVNMGVML
jgi:hypothetical protein